MSRKASAEWSCLGRPARPSSSGKLAAERWQQLLEAVLRNGTDGSIEHV